MPAEKISDLLPLPNGCREPHAYQIFGLTDGEQDPQIVSQAIQKTVKRLKACKDETEPKVWKQAAKLVNDAKTVLGDPDQKAELDARFGIFAVPEPVADHRATPTQDPLAAVLPAADPLASMLPSADPMAPASPVGNPATPVGTAPTFGVAPTSPGIPASTPAVSNDLSPPAPAATPEPAVPSIAIDDPKAGSGKSRRSSRRRRSSSGILMFGGFMVSMLGLIGFLVYFVYFMEGVVSISQNGGDLNVSNQPAEGTVNGQAEVPPAKPSDPIMGEFAEEFTPGPNSGRPSGLTSDMDDSDPNAANDMGMDRPAGNPMTTTPDMSGSDSDSNMGTEPATEGDGEPTMDNTMEPGTNMEPEPTNDPEPQPDPKPELTEEMIAEADSAVEKLEELIRSAKWKEMLPAAEQLLEIPMETEQRVRAEALHELADLATYYRGGIEKAVADLNVGNDFEVTKDFRVIVVEKGEDLLVVRFNERNKSFRFDEFSFPLAHKLASFAMPKTPGAQAAKAVYQAIAPRTNDGYVEQSLKMLQEIDPETEEVDVARAIETLKSLVSP